MGKSGYEFYGIEELVTRIFSERLKKVRATAGLTQQQFAKEFGISVAALSYYETGKRIPDVTFLAKLYEYFGVPTDYFLGYADTMSKKKVDVSKKTHLSDKALDNIVLYIEDSYEFDMSETFDFDDVLNSVLEDPDFYKVLDLVTWSGTEFYTRYPDEEYVYFIATKKLMKVLRTAAEKLDHGVKISSALKGESLKTQEDFIQWLLEESEKGADELNKRRARREAAQQAAFEEKFENEYKKTVRYKALKKLQEAENNAKHNHTP